MPRLTASQRSENRRRADNAHAALAEYRKREDSPKNDVAICDLLTDLMHLCERDRIKFADKLNMAQLHFDAEINGQP